jgi:uncharacterized protein YndB with AHSA1/START domain
MNNSSDATFYVTETKLVVRRTYNAPAERVFQAWVDPVDLAKWFSPGPDWIVEVQKSDLRIGGEFKVTFGPKGEVPYLETGAYREITPPYRLSFLTTLHLEGALVSLTDCEISFLDLGATTEVTLVETGGDREQAEQRAEGWGSTMDNLHRALE